RYDGERAELPQALAMRATAARDRSRVRMAQPPWGARVSASPGPRGEASGPAGPGPTTQGCAGGPRPRSQNFSRTRVKKWPGLDEEFFRTRGEPVGGLWANNRRPFPG